MSEGLAVRYGRHLYLRPDTDHNRIPFERQFKRYKLEKQCQHAHV